MKSIIVAAALLLSLGSLSACVYADGGWNDREYRDHSSRNDYHNENRQQNHHNNDQRRNDQRQWNRD